MSDGMPVAMATRLAIRLATDLGIGWLVADEVADRFDFDCDLVPSADRRGSKGRELRRSAMGSRNPVQLFSRGFQA